MNPLLVMAILSAASMGANAAGQKKVDKARAAAMREERTRNERLAQKSDAAAQSTAEILTNTPQKEAAAAAEREASALAARNAVNPLTKQTTDQMAASTLAPVTSARVIEDAAQTRAKTGAYLDQQAKARAALSSFGDVMANNNIAVNRNEQDIGQVSRSMQNWNQFVLPQQLNAANGAGRNWQTLADAIQVASMIYGGVGLVNGAAGAAANAGANAAPGLTGDAAIRAANYKPLIDAGYGANYFKPVPGQIY